MSGLDFGFFPDLLELRAGDITISTLPEFEEVTRLVRESPQVDGKWFYAPPQESRDVLRGTITAKPYSTRVFGLEKTHRLEHASSQDLSRLRFLMHCLAFFEGVRLDDTGAGFLDATPIERGTLTDFALLGDSLGKALEFADRFWVAHETDPKIAERVLGIFQSLSLSQAPQALSFERFVWAYTAIEGAFVVAHKACGVPNHGGHPQRIANLCTAIGIQVPKWATNQLSKNSVKVRNDALHEGLFLERPLGYESLGTVPVPDGERSITSALPAAMQNFVCRVVLWLLGIRPTQYLQSSTYERSRFAIRL